MTARAATGYVALAVCAIGIALAVWFQAAESPAPARDTARLELDTLLSGEDSDGFARALEARAFAFPPDHGPHPDFRSEWWYFTGNLEDEGGRQFGYQWTLFRFALTPEAVASPSRWATRQAYMGHVTITDVAAGRFHAHERLARGALELAGARAAPLRVWIEDWALTQADASAPWRLQAADGDLALDLELVASKPVVPQGERGLSRKGDAPGNASYYYSVPRLETSGTLIVGGERFQVRGTSWLDREWSTSALEQEQAGWDWFGLQLSDNTELMLYRLRRKDGSIDRHSSGSYIDAEGKAVPLAVDDVEIYASETWQSSRGGRYPAHWRIVVKPVAMELEVIPRMRDQELDLSVRYWEGAVSVSGTHGSRPLAGVGYVELTGY